VKLVHVINSLSDKKLSKYAYRLGEQVGVMHSQHIYHGDLTLGNIIIGRGDDDVYIIDFGLAGYSMDVEEYAIDIHLLRRSLTALAPEKTSYFMEKFLRGYKRTYSGNYEEVIKRVEEIRMRGRYVEERLRRKVMRDRYVEE
jgi:TP53 regulating kinase-like protein